MERKGLVAVNVDVNADAMVLMIVVMVIVCAMCRDCRLLIY